LQSLLPVSACWLRTAIRSFTSAYSGAPNLYPFTAKRSWVSTRKPANPASYRGCPTFHPPSPVPDYTQACTHTHSIRSYIFTPIHANTYACVHAHALLHTFCCDSHFHTFLHSYAHSQSSPHRAKQRLSPGRARDHPVMDIVPNKALSLPLSLSLSLIHTCMHACNCWPTVCTHMYV